MSYDFTGLTPNQQALLTFAGWTVETEFFKQPAARTVKKLIDRGLVIPRERDWAGVRITEYEVPLPVHFAWCLRCSGERA